MMRPLAPYLPAFLVVVFAAGLGTFPGATGGWQALLGHGLMLALLVAGAAELTARRCLVGGLVWLAVAASWAGSPVPRAGVTVLALLPGFLVLPWLVARCWRSPTGRAAGLRTLSLGVAFISAWSLVAWGVEGTERAAMPLGHHNLLAAWLVVLWPLAVVPWRRIGPGASLLAGSLAAAALMASGSLSGAVATACGLAVLVWRSRGRLSAGWAAVEKSGRRRKAAVALALVLAGGVVWGLFVAGGGATRLGRVLTGEDLSATARAAYARAAWHGFQQRPFWGWGPGATRWTLSEHLEPAPGVLPPGQLVADAHNLPLQWIYELGALGGFAIPSAMLALAWGRRTRRSADRELTTAALVSLVGGGVMSFGGFDLAVTALPVAVLVALGGLLASRTPGDVADSSALQTASSELPGLRARTPRRLLVGTLGLALAVWQLPRDLAHLSYDRAVVAGDDAMSREALRRSVRLDPSFPAYRWRLALLEDSAEEAAAAAKLAQGLSGLWLLAGDLQATSPDTADHRRAVHAWTRACDLDPLGALAPFRLATHAPDRAVERVARALVAEPLLLAATGWGTAPLAAGVERLRSGRGVEAEWGLALDEVRRSMLADPRDPRGGAVRQLGLRVDPVAGESISVHVFRRRPWPALAATVELSAPMLEWIDLPPAVLLTETVGATFGEGCRWLDFGGPRLP